MDGLIIKKKWLDLIVDGKKTIEIRGSDTNKQNETIYLLVSMTERFAHGLMGLHHGVQVTRIIFASGITQSLQRMLKSHKTMHGTI